MPSPPSHFSSFFHSLIFSLCIFHYLQPVTLIHMRLDSLFHLCAHLGGAQMASSCVAWWSKISELSPWTRVICAPIVKVTISSREANRLPSGSVCLCMHVWSGDEGRLREKKRSNDVCVWDGKHDINSTCIHRWREEATHDNTYNDGNQAAGVLIYRDESQPATYDWCYRYL